MTRGWSLPAVLDVLASAAPGREMIVWGDVRRTFADVAERTRRLAAFLAAQGLGARRERDDLERWECGQSTVALALWNCPEYLEAMYGCFRARAVPVNVNHHYRAEVRAVLDMVGAEAVVYHRGLAPLVADALGDAPCLLLHVEDGSGVRPLPGSTDLEAAIEHGGSGGSTALPEPSPDDLYVMCTGGTTGAPKAVLWRQADAFVAALGGSESTTAASLAEAAAHGAGAYFPAPPLMHAAAQWTAFAGLHSGAKVVLHDDRGPFDARAVLTTAAREGATLMSIVGDAYARPIVEELRARPYDLSSLQVLATGGAPTNDDLKRALVELLPHVTVVDGYGASETGGMAYGAQTASSRAGGFAPAAGAAVLAADRSRFLTPGDDEIGWTARRGAVPLGYLGDRARTEATFPIIDGERVSVPGDRARLGPDGRIEVLGRDALVVNTGGEKVFVEEVEDVLRRHPAVADAVVTGRPSERFGQEVVAIVALRDGADISPAALREHVAQAIARFKAPRAVAIVERVVRHANGKADYAWARTVAPRAVEATTRTD